MHDQELPIPDFFDLDKVSNVFREIELAGIKAAHIVSKTKLIGKIEDNPSPGYP